MEGSGRSLTAQRGKLAEGHHSPGILWNSIWTIPPFSHENNPLWGLTFYQRDLTVASPGPLPKTDRSAFSPPHLSTPPSHRHSPLYLCLHVISHIPVWGRGYSTLFHESAHNHSLYFGYLPLKTALLSPILHWRCTSSQSSQILHPTITHSYPLHPFTWSFWSKI